jgi:type III pantothenate kinase
MAFQMDIVLDIGNTRRKVGVFEGRTLKGAYLATDWEDEKTLGFCKQMGAKSITWATVAADGTSLKETLAANFKLIELTHETPLPFINRYTTPQTLGKDRLAAVAGAQALWPSQNCLAVDCGTCIKYDFLDKNGIYWGGNIAPGAHMRAKAMHEYTARLPMAEQQVPDDFVGDSTLSALQNGAYRGALLEIEGFVRLFAQRFGDMRVCLTGGDAAFFQPYLAHLEPIVEPHLVLHGLQHIHLHLSRNGFEQH